MNDQTKRRIAFYRRTATESTVNGNSSESQLVALRKRLAESPGAVLAGDYEDSGVSGTVKLAERPAGARLCRDAALGIFDEVWATSPSRLGRKLVDTLDLADFFSRLGAHLDVLEIRETGTGETQ